MSKLLKNKIVLGALLSSCALSVNAAGSVEESIMRGLRGGIEAIQLPMKVARERAEDLYTYNHGADIATSFLDLGTNEYLAQFKICKKYWVKATFTGTVNTASSRWSSGEISDTATVPLPAELLGKTIYLVPVYNANDYKITTWECVTNFNLDQDVFKGDTGAGVRPGLAIDATDTAVRSTLAKYTSDSIMQKCVYAAGDQWTSIDGVAEANDNCTNAT